MLSELIRIRCVRKWAANSAFFREENSQDQTQHVEQDHLPLPLVVW